MGKHYTAIMVIILIALTIPASALSSSSSPNADSNRVYTANPTTILHLLNLAEKLANYTASQMTKNTSMDVVELYQNATTLLNEAWNAYNSGNYTKAIRLTLVAMKEYKEVLMITQPKTQEEDNSTMELVKMAYVEIGITKQALQYAEKVMEQLRELGINYTSLQEQYEFTSNMTERVETDIRSRNCTTLKKDVSEMTNAREALNREIERAMKEVVKKRTDKLVKMQLKMLERLMMEIPQNTSDSQLKSQLMLLNAMKTELQEIVKENNPQVALEILKSFREELERTLKMIQREKEIGSPRPRIGKGNETAPPAGVISNQTSSTSRSENNKTKPQSPENPSNSTKNERSGNNR